MRPESLDDLDLSNIDKNKCTIVLDMDETLICAYTSYDRGFDMKKAPEYMEPDIEIQYSGGDTYMAKVIFRPYLFDVLEHLA
jgi:hypothetical protein